MSEEFACWPALVVGRTQPGQTDFLLGDDFPIGQILATYTHAAFTIPICTSWAFKKILKNEKKKTPLGRFQRGSLLS